MNTVAKGNNFENQVFQEISKLLSGGSLGLNPELCRLFQKKGYYSKDRDSEIVVDISVEVWLPGADKWSMLWVCECKDYSSPIPISDLEEFKAKLNQITGVNVKGLFVGSSAFQRGALNYASSQGIGVLRLLPKSQIEFILYQMAPHTYEAYLESQRLEYKTALVDQNHRTESSGFYSLYDGRPYHDWKQLLKKYFIEDASSLN